MHPNGTESTREIVAVRMSQSEIDEQHYRLRMSSYRWEGVKGFGDGSNGEPAPFQIPRNFEWFVEQLKEKKQIGWMDFVANVGVNVPVQETLEYMGGLYATQIVVGDWLLDVHRLSLALRRGWIFQESAFCELDGDCLDVLFSLLRRMGLAWIESGTLANLKALISACNDFSLLLERRAYLKSKENSSLLSSLNGIDERTGSYYMYLSNVTKDLRIEDLQEMSDECHVMKFTWAAGYHPVEIFTMNDTQYRVYAPELKSVTQMPCVAKTGDEFMENYCSSIVSCYLETELTYEADRLAATTAVPCAILSELGQVTAPRDVIRVAYHKCLNMLCSPPTKYFGWCCPSSRLDIRDHIRPGENGPNVATLGLPLCGAVLNLCSPEEEMDVTVDFEYTTAGGTSRLGSLSEQLIFLMTMAAVKIELQSGRLVDRLGTEVAIVMCLIDAAEASGFSEATMHTPFFVAIANDSMGPYVRQLFFIAEWFNAATGPAKDVRFM